jgi:tetratricopeptide (TPR) repeat protein
MATKKKIITVRIKTPDAISELNRIVKAKFKPLKADLKKGVFIFTYRYGLQAIKVNSIVRAHKGITVIQIVAKTDDLIGTGGKKAISILESELKKVEPKYLVDYEIEIAFQKILKGDYIESYNTLKKASKTRPKTFKLNYGLALCYVAKNEINKAREYIYRALAEINQTEQIVYRKRIAVKLFKLKRFQLSSEIFEQVYEKEKSNKEIALFYFNLLFKSGDL